MTDRERLRAVRHGAEFIERTGAEKAHLVVYSEPVEDGTDHVILAAVRAAREESRS